MEYSDNILHAAYFKHAYTHCQAHSKGDTQCSALILDSRSGIVLATENLKGEDWYRCSAIQNLFFRAANRGVSCMGMDMYCPAPPTQEDAIAIRECGIRSFTFHKEYADICRKDWSTPKMLEVRELLETNGILIRCWNGKVSKKNIEVKVNGDIFHP